MKLLVLFLVMLISTPAYCADDTKTLMASFVSAWIPSYKMEEECFGPTDESEKIVCSQGMYGYYIYSLRPRSAVKAPRNIRVVFISHSPWLHKSNNVWLLQLKKLDPALGKKLGADYELINSALINGDRCAAASIPLNSWLYVPKFPVVESVVSDSANLRGRFCYTKHNSAKTH